MATASRPKPKRAKSAPQPERLTEQQEENIMDCAESLLKFLEIINGGYDSEDFMWRPLDDGSVQLDLCVHGNYEQITSLECTVRGIVNILRGNADKLEKAWAGMKGGVQ